MFVRGGVNVFGVGWGGGWTVKIVGVESYGERFERFG